ncbi:alginate lyase family protein [Dysgonomonas sp. 511]|uniref:alginate lyase family protein n=1 Tax=Dysgonomonas sp. 511 TaxID=2302930 RepID=UPI0013D78E4A|nr:alginate lyase family protein [Dysgonomonas sp. 511]NDV77708.1 hypothetical protein [Dysgonomonas sp. 511]
MKKIKIAIFVLLLSLPFGIFAQQVASTERLEYAKKNIKTITNGDRALKALVRNADKHLETDITPVTEKSIVAPTGDKHDYVSMGPYWWPDPSKPDGLPYIRKDGQRNPELQKLDRNKIDVLTKSIRALSYAYFFTGEEKYAKKAVDNLKVWFLNPETKMNPNLNYGQMIPGRNGGKGRAEGIIDTYSFVEVVDCIRILSKSKAMKPSDYDSFKQWFSDFLDWLLTSEIGKDEYSAKNNHGLAYDVQVTAYAIFSERNDVADKFIKEFAANRLFKQIEPDGSQPLELARTIALHYSIFNIEHAMDMCDLGKVRGVNIFDKNTDDGRSISKAIDYIRVYLGKAKEEFPYKQIKEWDENQNKLCWMLRRSTFFHSNPEFDKLFDQYCKTKESDTKWLFYAK